MRWELTRRKSSKGDLSDCEMQMQNEIALLKSQLEQSSIDRENLHKQLKWQQTQKKNVDTWTPFPTMARKFSNSDENDDEQSISQSQHVSVVSTKEDETSDKRFVCSLLFVSIPEVF